MEGTPPSLGYSMYYVVLLKTYYDEFRSIPTHVVSEIRLYAEEGWNLRFSVANFCVFHDKSYLCIFKTEIHGK